MKRRTYLAALSASSLAGCLGVVGSPGASTPVVPDGVQRQVDVVSVDDVGHDLAIEAAVVEPSVTDEHPARVAVTTTNEGRERDVSIAEDMCCLFNREGGRSDPEGLWLHRTGSVDHSQRDGDRWARDRDPEDPRGYPAYGCLAKTYAGGESVTNEYHVWDDYRTEGYLRPGTYRFAEPVTVSEPDGDATDESAVLAEFEWGFSVRVERP